MPDRDGLDNRQLKTLEVLGNWGVVWVGNLAGALGLVFLVFMSHHMAMNNGAVGEALLKLAIAKIAPDFATIFFKGVSCNILVCLAVWLSYAGRSVVDKMAGSSCRLRPSWRRGSSTVSPTCISCPGLAAGADRAVPAGLDVSAITLGGIGHNLEAATLGNIVGGAGFVGFIYWAVYRKSLAA